MRLYIFVATFVCPIITPAPSVPNPIPLHFSISLINAEYTVSAFPPVISTSLMEDILLSPSSIYFTVENRSIYFLFLYKTTKFLTKRKKMLK